MVETLIAIAIATAVAGVLGTAIYQLIGTTNQGNDIMTATHEIQNAAHWVALDGCMASAASGGAELELTIPGDSTVTYSLSGTEFTRTSDGSQLTLARNISGVSFLADGRVVTMNITSSPDGGWGMSRQGIYKICLRPSEG